MTAQLQKEPYAAYSFIMFYKRGDLIQSIDCLKKGAKPDSIYSLVEAACQTPHIHREKNIFNLMKGKKEKPKSNDNSKSSDDLSGAKPAFDIV